MSAVIVGGVGSPSTVELRDDGRSSDGAAGDGVYGGRVPRPPASQTSSYMIRAEDASGNVSVDPPNAPDLLWQIPGTFVAGPLAVNEFLASNSTGLTDAQGEHDDWIEILNISGSMIDLRGRYLTDNLARPNKWALPDTTLPPGGIALIWADDQGGQGRFHAPFKLDKAGEAVGIFDSTSDGFVVMDSLTYGLQETDISWGRHPDGNGAFAAMRQPTPGQPNVVTGDAGRTPSRQLPLAYTRAVPQPVQSVHRDPVSTADRIAGATRGL
ncbi:MAG: lamin tail domain-containing protein [Ignavibacteriae bacterium]|nr:lamin tail domain-containing protein [Ignavibacteriota bacterium]